MKRNKSGNPKHGARSRGWGRGISSDAMRGKREELEKKDGESGQRRSWINDAVDLYKNRVGPNRLRVIPPLEAEELEYYGYEVWVHSQVGNNNDAFLCYSRMRGEACARCERQKDLWDDDFDLAKQLYPTKRVLLWVQDLFDDEEPEKPLLFDCPKTLAAEFLKRSEKKRKGKPTGVYIDPSHPTNGRCVTYDYIAPVRAKKGQGGEPGKYENVDLESEAAPDLEESIMDELVPFEDCLNHHEYEELQEVDSGGLSSEESEELEEPEGDEFAGMDRTGLKAYIKNNELDIRVVKSMADDDIREAIRAMGPEEEEEEVEPEGDALSDFDRMDRRELKTYIKENDLNIKIVRSMTDDDIRSAIQETQEEPEEPEKPEEEEPEEPDFDKMNRRELKIYIKEEDLDIRVVKSMTDDDLRGAIAEELSSGESGEDIREGIRDKLDKMKKERE